MASVEEMDVRRQRGKIGITDAYCRLVRERLAETNGVPTTMNGHVIVSYVEFKAPCRAAVEIPLNLGWVP